MKSSLHFTGIRALTASVLLVGAVNALAFPPAPHHTIYGLIRDEMGNPLETGAGKVIFESSSGTVITTSIVTGDEPGENYSLSIPMDAGITADLYKSTALTQTVPFVIRVQINGVNYLPIQMQGQFGTLGKPGQRTHLDLTLGADTDGDGLPDAWERALLSMLGGGSLADVDPNGDADGDGLSNLAEYIAGTYAFDPEDGFSLKIERVDAGKPVLKFLTIAGRSYTVQSSTDLKAWSNVPFVVPGQSTPVTAHKASDTRIIEASVAADPGAEPKFFRLIVQ